MSVLEVDVARAHLAQTDITGEELAEIAAHHPSLRVLVAAHPNTYPALLTWLGVLGDPAVDGVLAARTASAGVGEPPLPPPPPLVEHFASAPVLRRRRTGMWIAIVAVAILAIGGATTAALLGRGTSTHVAEPAPISALFPDPGLAECIAETLGASSVDAVVTQADLATVNDQETLDSYNSWFVDAGLPPASGPALNCRPQIVDLTGIEYLADLQILELNGKRELSDISPLAGLTHLQWLGLGQTNVSDLSPVAGLTDLRRLALHVTPVSDISPLAGLTELRDLSLDLTAVSDVGPLAGLTRLEKLTLGGNRDVSDIGPLAGLTSLQDLSMYGTNVSDASPLASLTSLQALDLTDTPVSDISALDGLVANGLQVDWG